jgi:hypothetical protein
MSDPTVRGYLAILMLALTGLSYVDMFKKRRVTKLTHRIGRSR